MLNAKEILLRRQLSELAQHSERQLAGHHVERFIEGYWVDRKGPMRFEEALAKIMVSVNEPIPQGFPCDI